MKKGKIFLLSLLVLVFAGMLAGCGREGEEETGSNPDSGNAATQNPTEATTGALEDVITQAETGVKEIMTNVWDAATGAAEDIKDGVENLDNVDNATTGATNE